MAEQTTTIPLETRFSEWVMPQITSASCFGPSSKVIGFNKSVKRKGKDQFSSTIQFFKIKVKIDGKSQKFSVVVKFKLENILLREILQLRECFHNELVMYSEVLPLIDKDGIVDEIFPKFYYGFVDDNLDCGFDYILLEDLSKQGYKHSTQQMFLDYDHCVLVLKQIGKFHALSYAAKKNQPVQFKETVSKLKTTWTDDKLSRLKYIFLLCGQRAVTPLMDNEEYFQLLSNFMKNYSDPVKFFRSIVKPIEPEAIICHGDFCRNNMLFAYDGNGKPVSVKFFDLQTPQYTSPIIDLSFFLFMNTNKEMREAHWDEFINIYKESVRSTVPTIEVPELDFRRVCIYGFVHSSYFLPIMLDATGADIPYEKYLLLTPYELGYETSRLGGDKETQYLADIIEFLLRKNYIRDTYY